MAPPSGRVVLYHENSLSYKPKHAIHEVFQSQNIEAQFYGPEYLVDQIVGGRRARNL